MDHQRRLGAPDAGAFREAEEVLQTGGHPGRLARFVMDFCLAAAGKTERGWRRFVQQAAAGLLFGVRG